MVRWSRPATIVLLLVLAGAETVAENGAVLLERPRLGEFIPSSPPVPAPTISVVDLAGNTVSLSEFAGRLVLINLWATWCEPCLREMPSLERLQSRLGDRIAVLGVSQDRGGGKTVEPFIAKLGLKSLKIYVDPKSAVGRAFEVKGLPTSLLIDRDGKVAGRVEGAAEWESSKIIAILERFLPGDEAVKTSSH